MATRRNLMPNPACRNNSSGWFASSGGRVTNLSSQDFPRSTGFRLNSSADGGTPQAAVGSGTVTMSAYVRCTGSWWWGSALSVRIHWYRNGDYSSSSGAQSYSFSSGQTRRVSVSANRPSNVTHALLYFDNASGVTADITAVLAEQGSGVGDYFDGDSANASWDGAIGNSTSTFDDVRLISPTGIAPTTMFGSPALDSHVELFGVGGIAPTTVFGDHLVDYAKVRPAGIEPGTTFGAAVATAGTAVVSPSGIGPTTSFGRAKLRTSIDIAGQPSAIRRSITYDLVLVARVQNADGPPTLMEVDSITWNGLSWAEELSKPQRLDVSASMANLSDATLRRLVNAREMPSELHLYRGSRLVFVGPFMNAQRQGETVTMYAQGLLGYARYWFVEQDLVFSQVDQCMIVKSLVDHWQGLEYGHFGIDTSAVFESGMLRDATYLANENHNIGQRIEELGKRINGFDVDVDPVTRRLQLHYPIKGIDRSDGEDAIVFDASNISNGDVAWSVGPDDVASEAYGTGTSNDSSIRSHVTNLDLRAQFGRVGAASSFDGVSEQGTLDGHTQALLEARAEPLFIPGPDVRVTPDADPTMYTVGDTVAYVLGDRIGVQGSFRIRKRTIKVSSTGRELASFEFA